MGDFQDLATRVLEFERRARSNPASAVGPELDQLALAAKSSLSGSFAAQTSPVAPIRWMNELDLIPTAQETTQDTIDIPYPVECVGMLPTILLVDSSANAIEPPPEAINVFLMLNRREVFTSRSDRPTSQTMDTQVVRMPGIDVRLGNTLFDIVAREKRNYFSVKFQWAVDVATVQAFNWGAVKIGLVWYIRERRDLDGSNQ